MMDTEYLIKALTNFKGKRILVIGDLILDKFVRGKVSRISPEAPVPVVEITDEQYMPGGAGNVICNLLEVGVKVYICSIVGDDFWGKQLMKMLKDEGTDVFGIFVDKDRPTSVKTRIIAEHQQVVRTDRESKDRISDELAKKLIARVYSIRDKIDAVIISDYGKGLISTKLIESVLESIDGRKIPVVVDPQVEHIFEYKNVTSITPNVKEAAESVNIDICDDKTLNKAGTELLERLNCQSVLITRGENGMSLFLKERSVQNIPTVAKEVYDVTGAGDTVASVFTLGLTCGLDFYKSAVLANYAAAVVVGKLGTAAASIKEITEEVKK